MSTMKDLLQALHDEGDRSDSITAHYGLTDDEGNTARIEMLVDLIQSDAVTDVIDKHFGELKDAKQRYKIVAFAEAFIKIKRMNGDLT